MEASRSIMFVPGHKADWIQKALRSETDSIIIDLEDSVPEEHKEQARHNAQEAILTADTSKGILIRPNALDTPHFARDILTAGVTGLDAFLLPKLLSKDDVFRFDSLITAAEIENEVRVGSIGVVASFETARSITNADRILAGPRIIGAMGAAAKNADVSREVGFTWSAEGRETLYLRSKIQLAARSAGLRLIALGVWQDIHDLEGLRTFAQENAQLGYTAQIILHPTHAPIVNEEYSLTPDQVAYYQRLVATFEEGTRQGQGAVMFEGDHIDLAHANHAKQLLAKATPHS